MMADWQELSGVERPHSNDLKEFWGKLQQSNSKGMSMDLRENEHLCAIAFVKRRFVRYFDQLRDYKIPAGGWKLSGWKLSAGMPSVTYMAAAHWLETAAKTADTAVFEAFYQAAYKLMGGLGEWQTHLKCLTGINRRWTSLDGNVFHPSVLENRHLYSDKQQQQAQVVLRKLNTLNQHLKEKIQKNTPNNEKTFTPVSPFYAVLMMDGDSLGKQMSDADKQKPITHSLRDFTGGVKEIVEAHSGFLIYAGGDDVLAILPIEDALSCAKQIRVFYLKCFATYKCEKSKQQVFSTLSGAIEYAHCKIPLTKVLYDAHHLLDDIAKEKTGRDSIAIRIQKPGGLAVEWSQPWKIALDNENKLVVETLATTFRQIAENDTTFSSKFFYKIRERFDVLNPVTRQNGEIIHAAVLDENQAVDLMCMEYLNSGKTTAQTMDQAKESIQPLLQQCRRVTRNDQIEDYSQWQRSDFLRVDAALLVRFLANKGVE